MLFSSNLAMSFFGIIQFRGKSHDFDLALAGLDDFVQQPEVDYAENILNILGAMFFGIEKRAFEVDAHRLGAVVAAPRSY